MNSKIELVTVGRSSAPFALPKHPGAAPTPYNDGPETMEARLHSYGKDMPTEFFHAHELRCGVSVFMTDLYFGPGAEKYSWSDLFSI